MKKKKKVVVTTTMHFDGKLYTFSKVFMKRPQANTYAAGLRDKGKLVRVIPTGVLRKRWVVYVRRK